MKNQKFNEAIDEIVGFIVDVQQLQMDQLKNNIKTVYAANAHEVDPHAIAQMILDTPIQHVPESQEEPFSLKSAVRGMAPAQPAIHLKGEMVCTVEKNTTISMIGNLDDLSYVKVGNGVPYRKEFYHHCSQRRNELVRLEYFEHTNTYECPVCNQAFKKL